MTTRKLPNSFTTKLAAESLSEADLAVAILWFHTHDDGQGEMTAAQLAREITDARFRGQINATRLAGRLAAHSDVVRGSSKGSFRIRASADATLTGRYGPFRRAESSPVRDLVLPNTIRLGGRGHLEAMRREVNGAYEYGFYNSCAVMARRLVETLLLEAIDRAGSIASVTDANGNLWPLGDIIATVKGNKLLRLSRGVPKTLDKVKASGDTAAHSRYYSTSQHDIDDLNPGFRHLVAELAILAGLK